MPDSRIDFSDIPESTDAELKRARRVGRPRTGQAKQLIAIRIAPSLLAEIRRRAARWSMPYQTLIHEMLEKAANAGSGVTGNLSDAPVTPSGLSVDRVLLPVDPHTRI